MAETSGWFSAEARHNLGQRMAELDELLSSVEPNSAEYNKILEEFDSFNDAEFDVAVRQAYAEREETRVETSTGMGYNHPMPEPGPMRPDRYMIVEENSDVQCEHCRAWHGRILPLSEYRVQETAPPFHPNCKGDVYYLNPDDTISFKRGVLEYEYPKPKKPFTESLLDALQIALDLVGFIPIYGEPVDFANSMISTLRGDYVDAALSMAALIPLAGIASTIAKWAQNAVAYTDEIFATSKWLGNAFAYTNEALEAVGGAAKYTNELINGLQIIDGKVLGKIPLDEYNDLRRWSVKRPGSGTVTLGTYTSGADSYIARAGDTTYFDMGDEWNRVMADFGVTQDEMFDIFNKPFLDDAIEQGKTFRFSHKPTLDKESFLFKEWEYIKKRFDLSDTNLVNRGGFWVIE